MIIDFHTHVFPPHISDNRSRYIDKDPIFASLYADEKARLATTDKLIASMDDDEIDISVLTNLNWTTRELCVATNDYILDSIARYPQRLIGFCAIPPESPEAAIAETERCLKGGIRGIGEIRPDMLPASFTDSETMPAFFEALIKNNLILLTHTSEPVGHSYPGKGEATPGRLYPLIKSFPELTIVCAHWGGGLPFYALMPEVKQAMKNAYFDTAASPFLYNPRIYSQVIQLVGAEKILFGSDYPLIPPSRYIREINGTSLSEEERGLILSGNARRLLRIKDRS